MRDTLDGEQKEQLKKEDNKRKKSKRDNLNVDEKEQLKKYKKKVKKARRDNLDDEQKEHLKMEIQSRKYEKKGKKAVRDNLGNYEKEQVRKDDKKRKMGKRLQTLDERNYIFNNVQMCSMVYLVILTTPAFRLIKKDFKCAIQEGPT